MHKTNTLMKIKIWRNRRPLTQRRADIKTRRINKKTQSFLKQNFFNELWAHTSQNKWKDLPWKNITNDCFLSKLTSPKMRPIWNWVNIILQHRILGSQYFYHIDHYHITSKSIPEETGNMKIKISDSKNQKNKQTWLEKKKFIKFFKENTHKCATKKIFFLKYDIFFLHITHK